MKKRTSILCAGVLLSTNMAAADIILFDLGNDEGLKQWMDALNNFGMTESGRFNLDLLNIQDVIGLDGPLGSYGDEDGHVPTGFIPEHLAFDSNINPWGSGGPNGRGTDGTGLVLSPSYTSESTMLLANQFVDSFDILFEGNTSAISFFAADYGGLASVDVSVYTTDGIVTSFNGLNASQSGYRYGILSTEGERFQRINIYDPGGHGAEGILNETIIYIPTPSVLAGLIFATCICRRNRRR